MTGAQLMSVHDQHHGLAMDVGILPARAALLRVLNVHPLTTAQQDQAIDRVRAGAIAAWNRGQR